MEQGASEAVHPDGLSEVVADKGYHSDRTLVELEDQGLRSYVSEPDRGRRKWKDDLDAQLAVYANRRRIRGERGKRLQRMRGELIERPFAHLYETGGMRRTHLRGHTNILKRLLIHAAGFNLGLVMRSSIGVGNAAGTAGGRPCVLLPAQALHNRPELRSGRFHRPAALQCASGLADSSRLCGSLI